VRLVGVKVVVCENFERIHRTNLVGVGTTCSARSIEKPFIDWSGNCRNLTSAVGPFAIQRGLVDAPKDGLATVRIWQANIGKKVIAQVPMADGQVQELQDAVNGDEALLERCNPPLALPPLNLRPPRDSVNVRG
jgi:2-methylaconitate cis-trans-isomerase PrpF